MGGRVAKAVALLPRKQGHLSWVVLRETPFLEFSSPYLALLFTLMVFV